MIDARRYAVWPEPRSRWRSRSLKESRPSVPHGTNFYYNNYTLFRFAVIFRSPCTLQLTTSSLFCLTSVTARLRLQISQSTVCCVSTESYFCRRRQNAITISAAFNLAWLRLILLISSAVDCLCVWILSLFSVQLLSVRASVNSPSSQL